MSNPVYVNNASYVYFTCDRDPTASEPDVVSQGVTTVNWPFFWWNQTSGDIFTYKGTDGSGNLLWRKEVDSTNVSTYVPSNPVTIAQGGTNATTAAGARTNLGLNINSPRSPTSISLAFNTSRQPSTTNDVFVSANIAFSAVLSLSAEVDIQTSTDNSTWVSYGKAKQQINIAATIIQQLYALIPAASYYRFVAAGSGASIDSIFEISL